MTRKGRLLGSFWIGATSYTYKWTRGFCISHLRYSISLTHNVCITIWLLVCIKKLVCELFRALRKNYFWNKVYCCKCLSSMQHELNSETSSNCTRTQICPSGMKATTHFICPVNIEPAWDRWTLLMPMSILGLGRTTCILPSVLWKGSSSD